MTNGVLKKRFTLIALYRDGSIRGIKMANLTHTIIDMYECNRKYWWVWEDADFYVIDTNFKVTDRRIFRRLRRLQSISQRLRDTQFRMRIGTG